MKSLVLTSIGLAFVLYGAQDLAAQGAQVPRGTNPTQVAIYPSGGQDMAQQQGDQQACYDWAVDRMDGWDPYDEYEQLEERGLVAKERGDEATRDEVGRGLKIGAVAGGVIGIVGPGGLGAAVGGAAIGAAAGGLIGGITSESDRDDAEAEAQWIIDDYNANLQRWEDNYAACMEGRGYTVS